MPYRSSPRVILFVVCTAQFFLPFMMAGVNAVLPSMGADISASAKDMSLIITFYALGLATFQLTTGRMGDIWGRRRIFLWGMGIFTCMCFVLGHVTNVYVMQALRFLQGTGGAMFSASGLAILSMVAPKGQRGKYIGLSASAVYAGIACGPPVAGFIAGILDWRWLFWANAVASALAFFLMLLTVREEWYAGKGEPFDWRGGIAYGCAMALLTFGSTLLESSYLAAFALMGTGCALLCAYVFMELRTEYPLLQVRLLVKNRVFGLSCLAAFINYASAFGMTFFFSLYAQLVRGMSVLETGLWLSAQFAVQAVVAPLSGQWSERYGASRISALGVALCGLGLLASAFLAQETPFALFVCAQLILGLGMGLFAAPNTTVIMESVGEKYVGQAASLVGTMRTSGALVNTTVISITFGFFLGKAPMDVAHVDAFLQSMRTDLFLFGILNLAAIACTLAREKSITTR